MFINIIPIATRFNEILTQILLPFINGNGGAQTISSQFVSVSELFHIIMRCHPKTDFFKFETNTSKDWIGIRYLVSHFPFFEGATPLHGIPIGKNEGLYWVKPLQVEVSKTGISNGLFPMEIKSVFTLTFPNGNSGQAGYIDRVNIQGESQRFHLYADGKRETAEAYPEHRFSHDLFRTLMGQILLAEIFPQLYQIWKPHIRNIEAEKLLNANPEAYIFHTSRSNNVFPFTTSKTRSQSIFEAAGYKKTIRFRS